MMTPKAITTYKSKSIPQLIKIAVRHYHLFIRQRDEGKACISCGRYTTLECGHFFSAGHHPALRFDEDNTHGQCKRCNRFLHGNLTEYQKNLAFRIGDERLTALLLKNEQFKRKGYKWDRFSLIEIIEKYKRINKELVNG